MQNIHLLRQLATAHEAQLQRRTVLVGLDRATFTRRRIGEGLMRLGARVAAEPMLRPARAAAR